MKLDYALLTDLYQITMAQGYWESGKGATEACFHMYFRDYPFKGGYAVACGMAQLAELVEGFAFSEEDRAYLASLDAPGGGRLFKQEFLDYLAGYRLSVDIDAVPEGTVVFPHEPIVRVCGPIMDCQLIETALLNCVNFETLIATKAARVCQAAQAPVAEFGLRRAQGAAGGLWASRAAVVGGCASTSNVLAGKLFGIPVSGTHAHSWVMSFPDELSAFRAYAEAFPKNCILLVDTYDVAQGVRNAITVGLEMRARGERLAGIRIDSGDLAWLAKMARRMLDEAGLSDCGIVLSNDLDEFTIQSIRDEGAQVMSWGVGTKLACAYDQPTLGGVYKLSATREPGEREWTDRLKISESVGKAHHARRAGRAALLLLRQRAAGRRHGVRRERAGRPEPRGDRGPLRRPAAEEPCGAVLQDAARAAGARRQTVLDAAGRDALAARARAQEGLALLDESQKRMLNPHTYPVGLEYGLFERRRELVARMRGIA
ncbi:MAG: nicotinate phosphoribosyltransferase [Gordonibacter pamelaeae]